MSLFKTCRFVCFVLLANNSSVAFADLQQDAGTMLRGAGFSGGFVVHLDCGDATLSEAIGKTKATQVHGLIRDASQIDAVRSRLRTTGQYGDISVDHFAGGDLPYVDNLVNLFVAEQLGDVSMKEVLRVLAPGGVAMIKDKETWEKTIKPWPENIDEWSHYLHDASGNSVAHDDVVGPPRHLQWVGSPRWSRHHDRMASMSALVSSGGRMFYIMDEGSRISIQLPPHWKLIARDAFNGSVLWKKDIPDWQNHLWPLKSGPSQLTRRLVSSDDALFVTLGYNAPVSALDPVTGEEIRVYEGSSATEEIIHIDGLLFLVVRKQKAELQDYAPLHGTVGDQAHVRENYFWNEEPRVIMAFDAKSGKQLWARQTKVSPLTLSADDSRIYFHDTERVISLDRQTGDMAWETDTVSRRKAFTFNFGPRLVSHEDVVLYAGGDGKMIGINKKDGSEVWDASFPNSGYQSPQDLMVVGGLVWVAPLTSGKDSGVYTGRDPRTGEVVKQFSPDVDTYWFHHRCYISKATDNFLMPSRTGIEFVDPNQEHWDIHHWVRGGCLYGVMPCNGLTYAPPHNCACYPEAKLFGFNALAPSAPSRPVPVDVPEQGRLQKGPAYSAPLENHDVRSIAENWPTYRHDARRSGAVASTVAAELKPQWSVQLGGDLSQSVISDGTVFVAQTDTHTLFALDELDGKTKWTYTIGARIDSPPTIHRGRVLFGGADGWVYCLTTNGELVWRYRAAPLDRRSMAYEQLESLWPVHGTVLVHNDMVYCVAGRSIFLDGGLRLVRLDLKTGKKLSETIMDEKNPDTGNNIQEKVQVLQMPVGLPDILSCDGKHIFMKSQKFDLEGNRLEIGPNSGEFAKQASKQRGEDAHIFAPMGFLDETWFHRSYWVLGQSFAGGHGGYYQAGKFAPSGRILVNGNGYVYGYGRKSQYLRWTTTLEHQLFAAEPNPPEIPVSKAGGARNQLPAGSYVDFGLSPSMNPTGQPLTIEAWINSTKPNGVIAARGGPSNGFSLVINGGYPTFLVRAKDELTAVRGPKRIVRGWHHIAGVLSKDKTINLYVDGELVGEGKSKELITKNPVQGFQIAIDGQSAVGLEDKSVPFTGVIDEVRLYYEAFDAKAIADRFENDSELSSDAVLAVSFDDGTARDNSLHRNNGTISSGKVVKGRVGKAIQFSGANAARKGNKKKPQGGSLIEPKWAEDVPIYVRGMVLSGLSLFIAGPPDVMDEEQTFEKLTLQNKEVNTLLAKQDRLIDGEEGGWLLSVNIDTGQVESKLKLSELPTWDGLSAAGGKIFMTTLDGSVNCYGSSN
ncbi:Outer membrane protein assembly factor BamB precursor [Planctomycetes bacterium CA13]|uniref:Outer membrane protein assembly factor BamB n=1 Tax=Novipirellula herctigrandis TaxID=2527986 RepID=A0A5C5Z037_9BACT|nr:Outer membrane protein assembly factor BamB precursor [Planctomycetes bacterium CA13]